MSHLLSSEHAFSRVQRPSIISRSVSNTPRWRDINDEVESSSKKTYGIHKPLTQEQKDDRALRIIRANNTRRQELEKNVSKHVNGIIDEKQIPKDTHNSLNEKHVSEKDTSIHSALKAIIRRIRQYTGDIVRE